MNFMLSESDYRRLKAALGFRLNEMRDELVKTDDRHYRADLRFELDELENLEHRLEVSHDLSEPEVA